MEVAYSFLCEAVRVDPNTARIDIDALDVRFFQAESLPTTMERLYLVTGFSFSSVEVGEKEVVVQCIDADGRLLGEASRSTLDFQAPPGEVVWQSMLITIVGGIEIEDYGDYSVRVTVNGLEFGRAPFRVLGPDDPGPMPR